MNRLLAIMKGLWSWIRTSKPRAITLNRDTATHHSRPSGGTW
jgi:hypothetical protein